MKFRTFANESTSYYLDEEFVKRCGGKIWSLYTYTNECRTFCCELTPSYEQIYLGEFANSLPENELEIEEIESALLESSIQTDTVTYMHCSNVDRFPHYHFSDWIDFEGDNYEEAREIASEFFRSNEFLPAIIGANEPGETNA